MARADRRKSSAYAELPSKLDVKVDDDTVLNVRRLLDRRRRLTRKLRSLLQLQARWQIERPDLTIDDLRDRIQKQRTETHRLLADQTRRRKGAHVEAKSLPRGWR